MRVFFLRIQTPRFGFQSEPCAMSSRPPTPYLKSFPPPGNGAPASTTTQLTPDFLIPPMKRMKIRDEKYPGSSRRRRPTKATCGGPVPTWGQIKALTNQAEELVKHQNGVVTPSTLFIAMLAVISCQVSLSEAATYWAYMADPPFLQPATWEDVNIPIYNNNTALLGGSSSSHIRIQNNESFSFEGASDILPMCFTHASLPTNKTGCIDLQIRPRYTDSPRFGSKVTFSQYRDMWSLAVLAPGVPNSLFATHTTTSSPPTNFPPCPLATDRYWGNYIDSKHSFPPWLTCVFPIGVSYRPYGSTEEIFDWSVPAPKMISTPLFPGALKGLSLPQTINSVAFQYSSGWVEGIFTWQKAQVHFPQKSLWQLLAAAGPITFQRPLSPKTSPLHLHILACVQAPFVLLLDPLGERLNVTHENNVYKISCDKCTLTNCLSHVGEQGTFVILKQPPFVMLPVKLTEPRYDGPGLQALQEVNHALQRKKRIIGAIILGITALISIIEAITAATTALIQGIHTANYVDNLSRNISLALAAQERIDQKLEAKVNALEEAVETIENQLLELKSSASSSKE
ncbi:uncharacterized protein LOC119534829 isoform X2 [Choloepus didactylus]|uniref:uncharacterized protein LOC119534829 isoform X2 n=1 Tax=Choloepus didactylus TaxID=27675 RepID=UPI00189DC597|nr:uncharacterized protein LOC119534829 isoform X2 [Choloepus didactylus]